jgi:hypothetical protein
MKLFCYRTLSALRVQRVCKWCKDFCSTENSFLIWLAGVNVFEEWCQGINEWCQFIITLNKLTFNARLSKNIKISTFEKASKSFHFRFNKQRQISLNLNHICRNRKRLINLINFANLYFIKRQVCREYSMYSARCSSIREMCLCIREMCSCIQRDVFLFSF